jgi:23S rRNA maturation mini-RNase III
MLGMGVHNRWKQQVFNEHQLKHIKEILQWIKEMYTEMEERCRLKYSYRTRVWKIYKNKNTRYQTTHGNMWLQNFEYV